MKKSGENPFYHKGYPITPVKRFRLEAEMAVPASSRC